MKYWYAEIGNGYCGCDEAWVISTATDYEPTLEDVLDYYPYIDGFAGIENFIEDYDDENDFWLDYEQGIYENSSINEISEAKAKELIDDGYSLIEM
jgi:hypothetical protein